MLYFEFMVAARYLRAKKKEGLISVIAGFSLIGVAIGVAALIVVMAVMNGFRFELTNKIIGFNSDVIVYGGKDGVAGYKKLSEQLLRIANVTSTLPLINGQVLVNYNKHSMAAQVKAVAPEDFSKKKIIFENIFHGRLEDFAADNSVVLGAQLAFQLGVKIGDMVTLISPDVTETIIGMVPRVKEYRVIATFSSGMSEYDSATIVMNLPQAQIYFRLYDRVNAIELTCNNSDEAHIVASQVNELLGSDYRAIGWQEANHGLFQALKIERVVMFMILTLIIFVAAFNIISSLIMLVKDKTRDIAILRTIGASRSMILRIFLICGGAIGVLGTMLGVILGISFANNIETIRKALEKLSGSPVFDPLIYYLSVLPSRIEVLDVVYVALLSLILSFLATIYPAWQATKLDPAEALRYE
jgi:lipoprotein-releasing system permease protein